MNEESSEPTQPRVDFATVDSAAEPQRFVRYLENASANAGIQALKRESYQLLDASEGKHLLDVGCRLGDDVRALAQMVGATGSAVGLDNSQTMIETARQRSAGLDLPGSFQQGDAHTFPFADDSFDGGRAERVLIHSDNPAQLMVWMTRVVRPGGRVVVIEPDLETVIIHLSDHKLARKLTAWQCDSVRNGRVGRQLPGLFSLCGLKEIQIMPTVQYATRPEYESLKRLLKLAEQQQALTSEEALNISFELEARSERGQYFEFGVFFLVAGRVPGY